MNFLVALLRNPKVLGAIAVLVIGGGLYAHHKMITAERDELRETNATLAADLETARANQEVLEGALNLEREAARTAISERNAAIRTLEQFRAGREDDPEALEWAAQPIPEGEVQRLCEALPEMSGCQPALLP